MKQNCLLLVRAGFMGNESERETNKSREPRRSIR